MAIYMWREGPDYLCFTANTAGSRVQLTKTGSPTAVTLETSTDGNTRTTYTINDLITLSNIGDKVYFRNTSETTTGFSTSNNNYYYFYTSGSVACSGDVTVLINKNGTDTLSNYCFYGLFYSNSHLTTPPILKATNLGTYCYGQMFGRCSNLEVLPKLPAKTLSDNCYNLMFFRCSKIKLSATQTGEYQTEYRIPTEGTGTTAINALKDMFTSTGGTFTGTPTINTTYYTSNQVI